MRAARSTSPASRARRSRTTRAGKAKPAGEPSDDSPTGPQRGPNHPPRSENQPRPQPRPQAQAQAQAGQIQPEATRGDQSQPSYFVRIGTSRRSGGPRGCSERRRVPSTPAIGRKTGLASAARQLECLQDGRKRKRHKGFRACRVLAKFRIIRVILISPDGPIAKPGTST